VQDVKDLMQRLIDACLGVEEIVIQDVTDNQHRCLHDCSQPQEDITDIHCEENV